MGVQGRASPVNFLDFNSLKSPLLWVSESFRQDIGKNQFTSDEALQLGKLFTYLKHIYYENLTDFRKTVVTRCASAPD